MKLRGVGIVGFLFIGLDVAQSDRGIITGIVQDPASAMVPGAVVAARNTETGAIYPTVTTATGNFAITALPAGTYEVGVEAPRFRKHIGQGTQVQVAQTIRLDIVLQVGSTSESVTVSAEAPAPKPVKVERRAPTWPVEHNFAGS
jgi:hypothetical protein